MARFGAPEGATPITDASGLLVEGILTSAALNAAEAENILRAANAHLSRRARRGPGWLTEAYVRRVHRDMFDRVWEWAGRYREGALNIGVAASRVREEVAKLRQDVAFWDQQRDNPLPIEERAARLHHRLAWIHPFQNGNGRHARLMADIYLFINGRDLPLWPSAAMGGAGAVRTAYLAALKKADAGDFDPLIKFTKRLLPKAR